MIEQLMIKSQQLKAKIESEFPELLLDTSWKYMRERLVTLHVLERLFNVYSLIPQTHNKILEIGPGFGQFMYICRTNNKDISGADRPHDPYKYGREFFDVDNIVAGDYSDIDKFVLPETYDAIVTIDSFWRRDNDGAKFRYRIQKISKFLNKRGLFIMCQPNRDKWKSICEYDLKDIGVVYHQNIRTIVLTEG